MEFNKRPYRFIDKNSQFMFNCFSINAFNKKEINSLTIISINSNVQSFGIEIQLNHVSADNNNQKKMFC